MPAAPRRDDPRQLEFTVALSAEPAFAETAAALVARAGDHAGCPADDARRLGDAVREVFAAVVDHVPACELVRLVVHGDERVVRVELRCPGETDLEECVDRHRGATPVERLVDRVEFGTDGTECWCRLTHRVRPTR